MLTPQRRMTAYTQPVQKPLHTSNNRRTIPSSAKQSGQGLTALKFIGGRTAKTTAMIG